MKKFLFAFVLATAFFSCATPSSLVSGKFMLASKKEGMIVGTIALKNMKYSNNMLFYSSDSSKMMRVELRLKIPVEDVVIISANKGDFKNDAGYDCFMFSIVAPENKYKFSHLKTSRSNGFGFVNKYHETNIPFEVTQGKVKYIGEITVDPDTGEMTVKDELERDRAKFHELDPNLKF